MPEKVSIEGKVDDKPVSTEQKTKVQHALKAALEKEFIFRPTHHVDFTHVDITFDKI